MKQRIPSIFIYQPTTGDRVLVEKATETVVIIRWHNGCRHVVGDLAHLRYYAAGAGCWWRTEAADMAGDLIALWGGVAWDENGEINLAVPRQAAEHCVTTMSALRRMASQRAYRSEGAHKDDERNALALWRVGAAAFDECGKLQPIEARDVPPSAPLRIAARPDEHNRLVRVADAGTGVGLDGAMAITAPESWRVESVSGGRGHEAEPAAADAAVAA